MELNVQGLTVPATEIVHDKVDIGILVNDTVDLGDVWVVKAEDCCNLRLVAGERSFDP